MRLCLSIAIAVLAGCHADIGTASTDRDLAVACGDDAVACAGACFDADGADPDDLVACLDACADQFDGCAPEPADLPCVGDAAVCLGACADQLSACELPVIDCDLAAIEAALDCLDTAQSPGEVTACVDGIGESVCQIGPLDLACFEGSRVCFDVCTSDLGSCLDS